MTARWPCRHDVPPCRCASLVLRVGMAFAASTALAAQRTVMVEDFTATWCGNCHPVGLALGNIMDDPNSGGRFVTTQLHPTISWGGDSYGTPWCDNRATLYGVGGLPTTVQDGILTRVGLLDANNPRAIYQSDFDARRTVPASVTLRLGGVLLAGQTYRISATIGMESTGTPRTVRAYIVQVLDHYPPDRPDYRNCFIQGTMPPGTSDPNNPALTTEDVLLVPGQSHLVQRNFTFTGASWTNKTNIRIVAWGQDPNSPLEVHQVAVMPWPFMNDCNGNGIPDEVDIATATSHDCNGNGIPDECDIVAFWDGNVAFHDCNGNGYPDGCEFANLTDCDQNGFADACEIAVHPNLDCNHNGVLDACDIAAGTSQDANHNGIPDECEAPPECKGDANCDHVVSWRDIDYFVAAQNDSISAWFKKFLPGTPACPFANCDVNDDGHVNWRDITPFVGRMNTTCPQGTQVLGRKTAGRRD